MHDALHSLKVLLVLIGGVVLERDSHGFTGHFLPLCCDRDRDSERGQNCLNV